MIFNSITFLFAFLPIAVIGYYLVPKAIKDYFLVAASVIFYAWGGTRNLWILLISMGFHYIAGLEVAEIRRSTNRSLMRGVMISTVAADIFVLCYFKYVSASLPLGISFYTFSVLSYLFDVYRGRAEAQRDPLKFLLYVSFFPKVISGPIVQYRDMEAQFGVREFRSERLLHGVQLLLVGLFKKVLIADQLGKAFALFSGSAEATTLGAWMTMITYSLQLYFDFSGYSDMAIGIAQLFGFEFKRNFDHPYTSTSVSEFWRRWHISLGAWFRDYVYIPLGGNRVDAQRLLINLLIVWALTGVWHGNTWNFVVWGLYHGAFVILERFVIKDRLDGIPRAIRILLTDLVAFVGWVFFFSPSIGSALRLIGRLVGIGSVSFSGPATAFYFGEYLLICILAIIGSSTFVQSFYRHIFYRNRYALRERTLRNAAYILTGLMLALAIAAIIGNTYSTFLYFQF